MFEQVESVLVLLSGPPTFLLWWGASKAWRQVWEWDWAQEFHVSIFLAIRFPSSTFKGRKTYPISF